MRVALHQRKSKLPKFIPMLNDLGAGEVNLRLSRGSGVATFTRASTAYTRLSTGLFALVGSGVARSAYAADGTYLGYFAEGARADVLGTTNEIRRTMTDVGWVAGATMTVGTATGADGVASAGASLTGGAVEATNTILFTTVLASAQRTFSAWVRRKTGSGTVSMTDNNGTNWTNLTLTTTYQLFQLTRTQANPIVGFRISTNTDAIEVDFNTIEAAAFANSTPIPVNVSKAEDQLSFPLAGNINQTQGTIYLEVTAVAQASQEHLISRVTSGGVPLYVQTNGTEISIFDGATEASSPAATLPFTTPTKLASSWSGTTMRAFNSGTKGTDAVFDGNMSIVGGIAVGYDGAGTGAPPFGSIRAAPIYNRKLSDDQLKAMTT